MSIQQLSVCAQKLNSKQNTTQTKIPFIHSWWKWRWWWWLFNVYDDGIGWTHPVGGAPAGNCRMGSLSLESWLTFHHMALQFSALHCSSVHWWAKKKQALDVVKLMRWSPPATTKLYWGRNCLYKNDLFGHVEVLLLLFISNQGLSDPNIWPDRT